MFVQRADDRRSFVTREIGGETLIVPVTGHVMELESIYVLNPVGSRIWELLRSPTTTDQIAALFEGLRTADVEAMPPAERRRFADWCRHWAEAAEPRARPAPVSKTGVLHDLKTGARSD